MLTFNIKSDMLLIASENHGQSRRSRWIVIRGKSVEIYFADCSSEKRCRSGLVKMQNYLKILEKIVHLKK